MSRYSYLLSLGDYSIADILFLYLSSQYQPLDFNYVNGIMLVYQEIPVSSS